VTSGVRYEWMRKEERMVFRTGKRTRNTTMCVAEGGRMGEWVGAVKSLSRCVVGIEYDICT
jgi:hypothetical protein